MHLKQLKRMDITFDGRIQPGDLLETMEQSRLPTRQEIEELTAFLPKLYVDGFSPYESWGGGKQPDGSIQMPYPIYNPVVTEFYRFASAECWLDYGYNPTNAGQMLKDEDFVRAATLEQIKTMLTFCVRGERFSDGHWGTMIEQGHIRRLLERLNEIKAEMPE